MISYLKCPWEHYIPSRLVPHSEQNLDVSRRYAEPHSSQNFEGPVGCCWSIQKAQASSTFPNKRSCSEISNAKIKHFRTKGFNIVEKRHKYKQNILSEAEIELKIPEQQLWYCAFLVIPNRLTNVNGHFLCVGYVDYVANAMDDAAHAEVVAAR